MRFYAIQWRKNMKKNKIVILICLCIILVTFLYVANSISIIKKPPNSPSKDYNNIKSTYDVMVGNLKSNKNYEALEQNLHSEINDLNILTTLSQDGILYILDECTKEGELNVSSIVFSEIRQIGLSEENEETGLVEVSEAAETSGVSDVDNTQSFPIEVIDVCIGFNSTYEDMILFVNKLHNYESDISIYSINILNKEEEERVYCTINLNFYAIKTEFAWLK